MRLFPISRVVGALLAVFATSMMAVSRGASALVCPPPSVVCYSNGTPHCCPRLGGGGGGFHPQRPSQLPHTSGRGPWISAPGRQLPQSSGGGGHHGGGGLRSPPSTVPPRSPSIVSPRPNVGGGFHPVEIPKPAQSPQTSTRDELRTHSRHQSGRPISGGHRAGGDDVAPNHGGGSPTGGEGGRVVGGEPRPPLVTPTRAFLGPHDVPPKTFAAYGIVAFQQKATPETIRRHISICEAFVATLPDISEIGAPSQEQMVTVWPLDDAKLAATKPDCKLAVEHYDLPTALTALDEARTQDNTHFSGAGPYLLAWAPSSNKGKKDALVLVADLSSSTRAEDFLDQFRVWREEIEQKPELWRGGWSGPTLTSLIRNWADKWGTMFLSVGHAKDSE